MAENDSQLQAADSSDLPFASSSELRSLSVSMVEAARRHLDLVSRALDPAVYDTLEFVAAVKKLALAKRSRIRILVLSPEALLSHGGHRLVDLSMRVSSHMEIRRPGPDHLAYNEAMLIADGRGVVYRKLSDRYEGVANFNAPAWAGRLSEEFEKLWQNAAPDPNFRRLML